MSTSAQPEISEFSVHRIGNDLTNQSVTAFAFIGRRFGFYPSDTAWRTNLRPIEYSAFPRLNPNNTVRFRAVCRRGEPWLRLRHSASLLDRTRTFLAQCPKNSLISALPRVQKKPRERDACVVARGVRLANGQVQRAGKADGHARRCMRSRLYDPGESP
jgi:hypothetical protein